MPALRLLGFLSEADYTSAEARAAVITLVGRDILESAEMSDSQLAVYRRIGDEIVEALDGALTDTPSDRRGTWHAANFFRVLAAVGTDSAKQVLMLRSDQLLRELDNRQLVRVLTSSLGALSPDSAVPLLLVGLAILTSRLRSAKREEWHAAEGMVAETLNYCRGVARRATPKAGRQLTDSVTDAQTMCRHLTARHGHSPR